jgi:hypothetical protein
MADYVRVDLTDGGVPKSDLTPSLDAYKISDGTKSLNGVTMSEISSSGAYQYDISSLDMSIAYSFQVDGGASLANSERYKGGSLQAQTGIMKNASLPNFEFIMILSSDHVTPAESKTITATISKDGGAFAACTNSASHISGGAYKIDFTQAEMNADIITLKFSATDCDTRWITLKTSS